MSLATCQPFGLVELPEDAKEDPRSESSLHSCREEAVGELARLHLSQSMQRPQRRILDQRFLCDLGDLGERTELEAGSSLSLA